MTQTRSVRMQITALLALFTFAFAVMAPPQASAQRNSLPRTTSSVLVTGTTAAGDVLNGVLNITSIAANPTTGALTATGTLSGTLTSAAGQVIGTVNQIVSGIPISSLSASCTILTLTLGPLDLNLLGLMVHLNQVVLNITAQRGAGNLLGNLLCSVAGLLDGGTISALNQVVALVNQILAAL